MKRGIYIQVLRGGQGRDKQCPCLLGLGPGEGVEEVKGVFYPLSEVRENPIILGKRCEMSNDTWAKNRRN